MLAVLTHDRGQFSAQAIHSLHTISIVCTLLVRCISNKNDVLLSISHFSNCVFLKLYTAANGGAGGEPHPPTSPPRGTLAPPPRTFTGLITEGQLEHYCINTEEKINGKYKRKVQETSKILINSLIFKLKTSKNFPSFLFFII